MQRKLIHLFKEVLTITVIWIILTQFYVYIKFSDVPDQYLLLIYGFSPVVSKGQLYLTSLLVSFPIGLTIAVLHTFVYPSMNRKKSFLFNIVLRIFVFLSIASIVIYCLSVYYRTNSRQTPHTITELLKNKSVVSVITYMLLIENLIGIVMLLKRSVGISYFVNMVINTYRHPKEEERVVMFLDLEDSTPAAEQMGHLKFSQCLQDCFLDLSDVVLRYGGEIYQFVGDEAVVTWRVSKKLNLCDCIDLYFAYAARLESLQQEYVSKYQFFPTFRCALHCGKVSAALVGDHKREIAYHGEVLHVGARLQSLCKKNDALVLASAAFADRVKGESAYVFQPVFVGELKGIKGQHVAFRVLRDSGDGSAALLSVSR